MAILRTHTGAKLDRPVQRLYSLELQKDEGKPVERKFPIHLPNSIADVTVPALRQTDLPRSNALPTSFVSVSGPVLAMASAPVLTTSGSVLLPAPVC